MVPSKRDFQSAKIAILELRQAVSRWLEGIKQSFLVFWKGFIALPNMNFADLSPCHVSSLSRADGLFFSDREEKWQEETSVELMSGSALRSFQNTKKISPIPSSHRNKAIWSVKIAIFADWKSRFEGTMPLWRSISPWWEVVATDFFVEVQKM